MNEKRVILVIEDEHTISNFICRALSANDYKPIPAFAGKEGLSLYFSHGPDLVLLDLGLPDMDGIEVLQELSGLPQETPVIIISARDRESEKVKPSVTARMYSPVPPTRKGVFPRDRMPSMAA